MLSKNAFKRLVKRCIAEVITEGEPPRENWTDAFGKKMPGEYIAEDDVVIKPKMKVKVEVEPSKTQKEAFFPKTFVPEAASSETKISPGERSKLRQLFAKAGVDGNGRFDKVEAGLSAVTTVLSSLGFNLDMVSKDMIMGDKGSRLLIFRRKNEPGQDIYTEKPEIGNSRIVFSWENMSQEGQTPRFEILAYAS